MSTRTRDYVPAAGRVHFLPLDSMRGLAAMAVVLHHITGANTFRATFPDMGPLDIAFFHNARLCVDLFFVLSGVVITMTYAGRNAAMIGFREFVARRFARLYPLHLTMLLVFVGFRILRLSLSAGGLLPPSPESGDVANTLYSFVVNALMLHALGFMDRLSWNGPSWSISAEFYTYLLFYLVLAVALGAGRRRLFAACSATVALVSLAVIVGVVGRPDMDFQAQYGILRCFYGFFIGALTCLAVARLSAGLPTLAGPVQDALQIAALATAVTLIAFNGAWPASAVAAAPVFGLMFAALMLFPDRPVPGLLSVRPLVWLGQRSYSVYMTHVLVIMISEYALRLLGRAWIGRVEAIFPGAAATAWSLAIVAAVLVLSDFTYRFVEQPGSQLLLGRRKARAATA